MSTGPHPQGNPKIAGERWRDAVAELDYAERHGASPAELEQLADDVIEARVELFQAGVRGGWRLPVFLQTALERDRLLLEARPSPQPLPRSVSGSAEPRPLAARDAARPLAARDAARPSAGGDDARLSAGGDGFLAAGR